MIVISGELLQQQVPKEESKGVFFSCQDGDVYSLLGDEHSTGSVPGTIYCANDQEDILALAIGKTDDRVRVIIHRPAVDSRQPVPLASIKVTGYVLHGVEWREVPVNILPVRSDIFSRIHGLFETDDLAEKMVLIVGEGSVGSKITTELAKSGVMRFDLIDDDRLEVANVVRHDAGLRYVGWYKTKAVAHLIKEKNPYAMTWTWEAKVSWENIEEVLKRVQRAHIVICATGERSSQLIINRVCVEEDKPYVFAGVYRRAYGGQLFVRSHKGPCYQCFCMDLPEEAGDREISNREQAAGLAYADRPVPIEPGLSTDIGPISLMAVKLVIQELLKGTETTLRSLDDDLVAPLYVWLNRRELGTQYEKLEPLEFNVGGLHILRWYGIDIKPNPACPVCGDFEGELAKEKGLHLPDDRQVGRSTV